MLEESVLVDVHAVGGSGKTDDLGVKAAGDVALDAVKGSARDEENVARVDLDKLLVGVLAATFGWNVHLGALKELEEGLLDSLARHIARDGRVVALAGNFVDFVDEDDSALGVSHVVVGGLKQAGEDAFDVFAHVASLGEDGRVDDRKRNLEHARNGAGQKRLTGAGLAHHDDIGLLEVFVAHTAVQHALVVVVDGYGEDFFGVLLTDHVLVEAGADFGRLGQVHRPEGAAVGVVRLLFEDVVGLLDAVGTDLCVEARHQKSGFGRRAAAK